MVVIGKNPGPNEPWANPSPASPSRSNAAPAVAAVMRATTPFAAASSPAVFAASPADVSALLFGSQDQHGLFAG